MTPRKETSVFLDLPSDGSAGPRMMFAWDDPPVQRTSSTGYPTSRVMAREPAVRLVGSDGAELVVVSRVVSGRNIEEFTDALEAFPTGGTIRMTVAWGTILGDVIPNTPQRFSIVGILANTEGPGLPMIRRVKVDRGKFKSWKSGKKFKYKYANDGSVEVRIRGHRLWPARATVYFPIGSGVEPIEAEVAYQIRAGKEELTLNWTFPGIPLGEFFVGLEALGGTASIVFRGIGPQPALIRVVRETVRAATGGSCVEYIVRGKNLGWTNDGVRILGVPRVWLCTDKSCSANGGVIEISSREGGGLGGEECVTAFDLATNGQYLTISSLFSRTDVPLQDIPRLSQFVAFQIGGAGAVVRNRHPD